MSSIVVAGDTSGSVTIQAPSVAGTTTLTLPTVSGGTLVTSDSSGNVGIGTSSPTGNLDIASSSNVNMYLRQTTGVCNTRIKSDSTNAAIGTSTNHQFSLLQNNTEGLTIDTSKNLQFNSGYGSVATAYGCRAWVNFNGTGTVAIRASGNVSSITDNGTGDYTVNFTNAMPDANYSVDGSIRNSTDGSTANRDNTTHGLHVKGNTSPTTSAVAIRTTMGATDVSAGAYIDYWQVNVNIYR